MMGGIDMKDVIEVKLSSLEEDMENAEIGHWYVQEGQSVTEADSLVEIIVGKAVYDVTAEKAGIVGEINKEDGEIVEVGEVLCTLKVDGKANE
jgi:pyruvate/2-oxoglutarate dehydrogenase complex dihydrolipoamide acyltransferase (E2) component